MNFAGGIKIYSQNRQGGKAAAGSHLPLSPGNKPVKQTLTKLTLLILPLFFSSTFHGQTVIDKLAGVKTLKQAKNFISKNPQLQGRIFEIRSHIDTFLLQQPFYLKSAGDIFAIGTETYKVLSDKTISLSRVSYIFLDRSRLKPDQIETLKKTIFTEYQKGVAFDSLASKYSMDGNQRFGDTGWFAEGVMAKEFADAVKQHTVSEIFTAEVPASHWYFIIKKTYETKQSKQMTILQVKSAG